MTIPIFLSSDNNYAPFVATTIASICDHTKSFCDFYVLDGGITEENQEKICELKNQFNNFSIEFIKIDVEKYFKDYPIELHYSKTAYARYLIPLLKTNLNKVLYSDVDVIVVDDILQMYNENLDNYPIGAVEENFLSESEKINITKALKISPTHSPFASGNLIIDCKKWREKNVTDKLLSVSNNFGQIFYNDQTVMNYFFENNYKKIGQKYCYTIQHDVCTPMNNVVICHYNGPVKPWHLNEKAETNLLPYFKTFWSYAKQTSFYEQLSLQTQDMTQQKRYLLLLRTFRMKAKKDFLS